MSKYMVLLIAIVLVLEAFAGCTNSTPAVTTTTTPTGVSGKDPIIGMWRHFDENDSDSSDTYQFNADGTFVRSLRFFSQSDISPGTWSAQGGNSYACRYNGPGIPFTMKYDPAKNAIYEPGSPNVSFTPVH